MAQGLPIAVPVVAAAMAGVAAWTAVSSGWSGPVLSPSADPPAVMAAAEPAGAPPNPVEQLAPPGTAPTDSEEHRPPVDAPVIDWFRPPAHVGAPGNRGWEYDPHPGQPVQASADGEVVFAGTVVYNRFVTVEHPNGLRTSYGYLGWIAVQEGDRVVAGQRLGTTSERFFFSVRNGDDYLDPASILRAGRVRLVPHHEPQGARRLPAHGGG